MTLWFFLFLAFLSGCAHKSMPSDTKSGSIEGQVTIGPLRPGPVRVDQPEPEVPPELFASHKIVVLSQDGKTTIVESKLDSKGNYKVDVPAGTYTLSLLLPRGDTWARCVLPSNLRVESLVDINPALR